MTKRASPDLFTPLAKNEIDELNTFLLSEATSDEVMQLDALDGYLTALVSGPVALKPSQWLPRVWGPSVKDEPVFETQDQAQRIFDLIVRHMNGIKASLEADPDAHEPIFDRIGFEDDPREYLDGEMWVYGFMIGIGLVRQDWQPLLDDANMAAILRPVYLLGSDEVSAEEGRLVENPLQREAFTLQIPASVAAIYRFWQPFRPVAAEADSHGTGPREQFKAGRNDPCPCGSGKKFKKCCAAVRH